VGAELGGGDAVRGVGNDGRRRRRMLTVDSVRCPKDGAAAFAAAHDLRRTEVLVQGDRGE